MVAGRRLYVTGSGWMSRVWVEIRGCGSKVADAGFDVKGGENNFG